MVAETNTETEAEAAQRNVSTVQDIYQAFGRADVGFILERLRGDIRWDQGIRRTELPYLQPGQGHQTVVEFFTALAANVAFDVFEPELFTASADAVMVLVRERGHNVQTGGEIAEDVVVHVWRFSPEGKVREFRHVGDFAIHERAAATDRAAAAVTASRS